MILPQLPKSKNKVRDARVIALYLSGIKIKQIVNQVNLSVSTIQRIIYRNANDINLSKANDKLQRLHHLARLKNAHPNTMGSKSTLDIIKEIRVEHEGEKGLNISMNQSTAVTIMPAVILKDGTEKEYNLGSRIAECPEDS